MNKWIGLSLGTLVGISHIGMLGLIMSTESLNKTSIAENYISKKTPKKVNIDVLKRKIYEQQKKEKMVGRIAIFTFFSFICVIGFIISA